MDLSKEDFLSYKAQVLNSIKISKMQRMTDENTLELIEKKLAEFPEEVEEEVETPETE